MATREQRRPVDLPALRDVTSVTLCRYDLGPGGPTRWESRELEGRTAERMVRELRAPTDRLSTRCYESRSDGRTSVRIEHASGSRGVVVRGHVCPAWAP